MKSTDFEMSPRWHARHFRVAVVLVWLTGLHTALAQTPVGTSFTYQGRLEQSEQPVTDSFDLEFNLYDNSPGIGMPLVTNVHCGVAVADGLFTVDLDFGVAFTGDARWIEVGVAPAGSCDGSTVYTYLSPLQPLTATPYALFALNGNEGLQGIPGEKGDPGAPGSPGDSHWSIDGTSTYYSAGNVGVGTAAPSEKVEVVGTIKATAFVGDGSGLTGIGPGAPTTTEPTAHTPAFVTCGTNAEQNPVQWSFITSGRFRVTLEGVAYDCDANFTDVETMNDVALRIQDALHVATLGDELVTWDSGHFVVESGDTTPSSSISELTTHSSGLGIDISGAGPSEWMDCDSGRGVVTAAVPNPLFYEGHLVVLNAAGEIDHRFMTQNLQEADTFFGGTDLSATQANKLIDGTNADTLHSHVPATTAGTASNSLQVFNGGEGTHNVDLPVGFSGATRFKMYYSMQVHDSNGTGRYGSRRGLIEGKLGGDTLDIAGVIVNSSSRTIPEIGWGDANVLGSESVSFALPSVSLDGSLNKLRIAIDSIVADGNNVRITLTVSNPVSFPWNATFSASLIAYK